MLEAETALRPESATLFLPVRQRGRRERRLVAAASAFVLIGGTTTMAAAAQSALPGDALYPIKRGIEQAQSELNTSPAGKGRDLLSQATDRLSEIQGLVSADPAGGEPRVPETLQSFSSAAHEGATLLFESFRETGDPETIVAVRSFTAEGIAELKALAGTIPDDAQDELASAAILLHDLDSEATALCGTCAPELPLVEVPGIFLARAEVDDALARVAGRTLDNNHPVVVGKAAKDAAAGSDTAPGSTSTPPADGGPVAPNPLPSPSWEPSGLPPLLPGLGGGGTSTGGTADSPDVTDKLGDVGSGLTGVVETLLPDPDGILD
jgi:hypothetical protein